MAKKTRPAGRIEEMALQFAERLELPPDLISGQPRMQLTGNRELFIDGHKGIVAYDDTTVKISIGTHIMTLVGRGLALKNLSSTSALVAGYMEKIEFEV